MTAESALFVVVHVSAALVAWLATYAVHSTIVLGGTWLLLRTRLRSAPPAHRELALKTALLAGVVTATLHTSGLVTPSLGPFDASGLVELRRWNGLRVIPAPSEILVAGGATVFGARLPDPAALLRLLPPAVVLAWALYAALVVARVVVGTLRARSALGVRREVTHGALHAAFAQVTAAFRVPGPVRLTVTRQVVSPVALGRREVCLPERALLELTPDEQRGVLAHEAAHLARRDPWWLLVAAAVESIFFFQPLNRVARMQLQHEAELLADDLAVRQVGNGVALARCLTRVAEWLSPTAADTAGRAGDHVPNNRVLAPMLAESRSSLVTRVQRLLAHERAHERAHGGAAPERGVAPARPSRRRRVATTALLPAAVLLGAPAFSGGEARAWGTPAFHWAGVVPAGQTVEIKSAMGHIRAEPWDGGTVDVSATRHGRATDPDLTFQVVRHAGGVTVCVVYPVPAGAAPNSCEPGDAGRSYNTPANDVEVEFLVRVPRQVGFAARTATGNVTTGLLDGPVLARSASGDVRVATGSHAAAWSASGDVTVRMGRTDWDGTLHIGTASGNITVLLPDSASTAVAARSEVGGVRSEFGAITGPRLGFWRRLALRGSLGERADGTLGAGGRTLVLSSTAGNIAVRRAH